MHIRQEEIVSAAHVSLYQHWAISSNPNKTAAHRGHTLYQEQGSPQKSIQSDKSWQLGSILNGVGGGVTTGAAVGSLVPPPQ
jgi:hypothetical protein